MNQEKFEELLLDQFSKINDRMLSIENRIDYRMLSVKNRLSLLEQGMGSREA